MKNNHFWVEQRGCFTWAFGLVFVVLLRRAPEKDVNKLPFLLVRHYSAPNVRYMFPIDGIIIMIKINKLGKMRIYMIAVLFPFSQHKLIVTAKEEPEALLYWTFYVPHFLFGKLSY